MFNETYLRIADNFRFTRSHRGTELIIRTSIRTLPIFTEGCRSRTICSERLLQGCQIMRHCGVGFSLLQGRSFTRSGLWSFNFINNRSKLLQNLVGARHIRHVGLAWRSCRARVPCKRGVAKKTAIFFPFFLLELHKTIIASSGENYD